MNVDNGVQLCVLHACLDRVLCQIHVSLKILKICCHQSIILSPSSPPRHPPMCMTHLPRSFPFCPFTHLLKFAVILSSIVTLSAPLHAQTAPLPASQRALEVRRVRGTVTVNTGTTRPAQEGDLLTNVGHGLLTNARSSSVLAVDYGTIGLIQIAEQTSVEVTRLDVSPTGGRITELDVAKGQVRLNVRPFNNPESLLEVITPAGVAAVRGTDFGMTISELSGRSAVATREGAVDVSAQNETVTVQADQYSTVVPGEPPGPPQPLPRTLSLDVLQLTTEGRNRIRFGAITDPPNLVYVNDYPVEIDRMGRFEVLVAGDLGEQLNVLVKNPLGEEQLFQLLIP